KCDGSKPVCGPCRKHPKDDECEYSHGPARSRTEALEETVLRLEARLHELEHREDSTPSVTLYDPYAPLNLNQSQSSTRSLSNTPGSPGSPLSPFSPPPPSSAASTSSFGSLSRRSSHGSSSSLGILDLATAPPFGTLSHGVQTFRPHASQFGFFLDWQRFLLLARHSHSPGFTNSSSALLNAIYMWGAHLSPSSSELEARFKRKALQAAATELSPQASFLMFTIQAEVLLAYYFFRTGRFLEARVHTGTAVALALGGGLHLVRSRNQRPDELAVLGIDTEADDETVHLRAPADAVEEGERINGFWAVFVLSRNLTVALEPAARVGNGSVFDVREGVAVDTPWPLEMEEYKQGLLVPEVQGDATVYNYLHHGTPSYQHDRSDSGIAMNVKACILLHRAVLLSGQWRPNLPDREAQSWGAAFSAVDELINALRLQLPPSPLPSPLPLPAIAPNGNPALAVLTHSLLNAATIKLHSIFYAEAGSRRACLDAARDMVRFWGMGVGVGAEPGGLGYLNPMMGTLWMTACGVFTNELMRIRSLPPAAWGGGDTAAQEEEMLKGLQDGLAALAAFGQESLLMRELLFAVWVGILIHACSPF
ncbi:hypothetical protein C8R46DRAFT_886456, partial [Mycena filopes]